MSNLEDQEKITQAVKDFLTGELKLDFSVIGIGQAITRSRKEGGFNNAILTGLAGYLDENPESIQGLAMMGGETLRQKMLQVLQKNTMKEADATVMEDDEF